MSIGKKQIATFANRVKTLVPSYNQTHHPQKEEITITRTSVEEGVYAPFSQNSNLEGMYIKAHTINDGREDYALNQLVAIEDLEYRFLTPEGSSPFNNCVDNSNSAKTIEKGGRYEATLTPKAGFSKVPAGHLEMLIDANTWETVQGQTWSRSNSIGITVDPVLGNLRFVLENGEDCIYNLTLNKRVDGVQQSSIVLEKTCSDQINVDSLHTEAQFDEQGLTYKNVKESDGTTVITGTTTFCGNTTLYIDYDSEVTPTTHIIDTSGVNTECVNVSISPSNPYPIPNGLSRTLIFSPKSGKTIGSGQITMGNTVIDSWNEDRTEEFEVLVNNITADVIVTIGCGSTPDPRYTVNLEWKIQDDPSAEPLAVKEFTEVVNTLINPESYKTYDGVDVESLGYTITSMSPSESFNLTGDTTITYYCSSRQYTITFEAGDDYVNINTLSVSVAHGKSITQGNVFTIDDPYELNAIEKTSGSANISYNPSTNEITVADVQSDVVITIYSKAEGTHTITLDSVCVSSNKDLPDSVVDGGNYTVELTLDKLNYDSAIVHITGQDDITLNSTTPYNLTILDIQNDITITSECVPYVTLTLEYYKLGDESKTIGENVTHRVSPGEYCITDADKVTIDGYTYVSSSLSDSNDCGIFNEDSIIKLYYEAESGCTPTCNLTSVEINNPTDRPYEVPDYPGINIEDELAKKIQINYLYSGDTHVNYASVYELYNLGWEVIIDDDILPSENVYTGIVRDCSCGEHEFLFIYKNFGDPYVNALVECYNGNLGTSETDILNGEGTIFEVITENRGNVTLTATLKTTEGIEVVEITATNEITLSSHKAVIPLCPHFKLVENVDEGCALIITPSEQTYPWYGDTCTFTITIGENCEEDQIIKQVYLETRRETNDGSKLYWKRYTLFGDNNEQFGENRIYVHDDAENGVKCQISQNYKTYTITVLNVVSDIKVEATTTSCVNHGTFEYYEKIGNEEQKMEKEDLQYYFYPHIFLSDIGEDIDGYEIISKNATNCNTSLYKLLYEGTCNIDIKVQKNGETVYSESLTIAKSKRAILNPKWRDYTVQNAYVLEGEDRIPARIYSDSAVFSEDVDLCGKTIIFEVIDKISAICTCYGTPTLKIINCVEDQLTKVGYNKQFIAIANYYAKYADGESIITEGQKVPVTFSGSMQSDGYHFSPTVTLPACDNNTCNDKTYTFGEVTIPFVDSGDSCEFDVIGTPE